MDWFVFEARNSLTLYGLGDENQARTYCSELNRHRAGDRYNVRPAGEREAKQINGRTTRTMTTFVIADDLSKVFGY